MLSSQWTVQFMYIGNYVDGEAKLVFKSDADVRGEEAYKGSLSIYGH